MISIRLLMPTRHRPKEAKEAIAAAKDTAKNADRVSVALRMDYDDTSDYSGVVADHRLIGPKIGCSPSYEELSRIFPADMVMVFADDLRFQSAGWDTRYEEVYEMYKGRPFALYPNDLHTSMATHPAVPRSWLKLFGSLWGAPFEHFYSDTWIHSVALKANRLVHLQDVHAEHISPKYGILPQDLTWAESREAGKIEADKNLFHSTKALREEWVERLKKS